MEKKDLIKVLIADDHQMFIDGLIGFLANESKIQVVGTANNGQEVINHLENLAVDVIIMDIRMPDDKEGIETTREVKRQWPNIKVLVLSMHNVKDYILELLSCGASGYILKNKSKEELIGAIHNVYAGKQHYGLEVLSKAGEVRNTPRPPKPVDLSDRERDVLALIGEGDTSKEIASKLHIAETTVNTYRRNLLNKLDVPNDKHLVRYAIKHGIVEL